MSPETPRPDDREPARPPEPVSDLETTDDESLTRLLPTLIPLALKQLEEGFGLRALRAPDPLEAEGALWSAYSSFQRHYRNGEFAEAENREELAGQLLRIACNRAQRRRRQEQRLGDATRRGRTRDEEKHLLALDREEDPGLRPDEEALHNELAAYLREAIDTLKGELRERPHALQSVEAYLADMHRPQADIARELGINQSTVSRSLEWFRDRIRQLLRKDGLA